MAICKSIDLIMLILGIAVLERGASAADGVEELVGDWWRPGKDDQAALACMPRLAGHGYGAEARAKCEEILRRGGAGAARARKMLEMLDGKDAATRGAEAR